MNFEHIRCQVSSLSSLLVVAVMTFGCAGEIKPNSGRGVIPDPRSGAAAGGQNDPTALLNPREARAIVGTVDTLRPASSSSPGFKVPGFSVTLTGATYAQILRCAASYVLKNDRDTPIAEVPADSTFRYDWMRWAWQRAHANINQCVTVATQMARPEFTDIAAPAGRNSFYYVVNPCVDIAQNSQESSDTCSYELVVTNPVIFDNKIEAQAISAAKVLADAEGALYAAYSNLYSQAHLAKVSQEACERNWAIEQANRSRWLGVIKILGVGVGVYVNTVMVGVGDQLMNALANLKTQDVWQGGASGPVCDKTDYHMKEFEQQKTAAQTAAQAVLDARQNLAKTSQLYEPLAEQAAGYFKKP